MTNEYDDYPEKERFTGIDFKYAMYAAIAFILINLGFIDLKGDLYVVLSTALTVYIWWSFRAYFIEAGDVNSAKWISFIAGVFLVTGLTSLFLRASTYLGDYVATGIGPLVNFLIYFIGFSLIGVVAVCIKIIAVNKHHSLHLKRIAISSAIFIPLYIAGILISNIQLLHQLIAVANHGHLVGGDMFGDGLDFSGAVSGIFSFFMFIWNLILMIPYYFLVLHFNKVDKMVSG